MDHGHENRDARIEVGAQATEAQARAELANLLWVKARGQNVWTAIFLGWGLRVERTGRGGHYAVTAQDGDRMINLDGVTGSLAQAQGAAAAYAWSHPALSMRDYVARDSVARFECACGENIEVEVGQVGQRVRPICECGRAWIITYTSGPDAIGRGSVSMVED